MMLSYKDKEELKRDICQTLELKKFSGYRKYSPNIYLGTDKINEIRKQILDLKKCLILTSSGDYAIDLATHGADVYTFDINKLSYYAQQLRIGAITQLEYSEFLDYFFGLSNKKILSENIYYKVREGLSENARVYYDSLYDCMYPEQIFEQCFDMQNSYKYYLQKAPTYLNDLKMLFCQYNEDEFYKAKEVDLQSKIHFECFNITEYENSPYSNENDFDLIQLSNVMLFLDTEDQKKFYNLLRNKLKNALSDSGILVNYFHSQCGKMLSHRCNIDNLLYNERRDEDLKLLKKLSEETYEIGPSKNGRGCYSDDLIHVIRK